MGRPRKGPWQRKADHCWYTTDPGSKKPVKLASADASHDEAFRIYCEYHANSPTDNATPGPLLTVSQLIDFYLEWVHQNRSENTYRWYHNYLRTFHALHGPKLRVANLRPYHVDQWVSAYYQGMSASHRRGAICAVQRVMNWAIRQGYIKTSPVRGMEKPTPQPRETVITSEQFQQLLDYCTDAAFRDYLQFLWETGCRPQEINRLAARHFDGKKLVLERTDSKGKRYNRVIYLNDTATAIIRRLCEQYPQGNLFRNSKGNTWSKNAVRCRFRRLKELMGIPELCATNLRHSWATHALAGGLDTTTASILMGHRDPATLARNLPLKRGGCAPAQSPQNGVCGTLAADGLSSRVGALAGLWRAPGGSGGKSPPAGGKCPARAGGV